MSLPDWVEVEPWQDWVSYREELHKSTRARVPWTSVSAKYSLRELERWWKQGYEQADVIGTAIAKGWRGLYEPKECPKRKPKPAVQLVEPAAPGVTVEQQRQNVARLKDMVRGAVRPLPYDKAGRVG